ncbi:MAG: HlyD family efflux transporter periplasmic adaptor subunit [Bacteroidales bacterium]|nr:HlyD family efflux transporter periplasmic adaptor subunit [Bacteroidales bacterium]
MIKEKPEMKIPVETKRFVKAKPVKYNVINSKSTAQGRLYSVAEFDLIAEASGKILQGNIQLKKGTVFTKGQVLFTVYTDEAILDLKSSKSIYLNSLANALPDIKIDFPEYQEKVNTFFSSININKNLPAFPDFENEKLKIFLSSRNLLSDYYKILKDELQLSRHIIRAPFNGTYTDVFIESGAFANLGGKVAHIIQTDILELEVPLERFDSEWIKIGDKVKIYSEKTDLNRIGTVVRKNLFIDENTQSQGIFIRPLNNQNPFLLVGEYLTANFPGHPIKNAMQVPRNIVFNTNEVFVIIGGRLQKKKINVIKINNENSLVFNGLPEGDTLVMQPLINFFEGTQIMVHK